MRVDDLRQLYHDFNGIYKSHVDDAKFDIVKGHDFKSLKERLIAVYHLLEKHPEVGTRERTDLIRAILSEDDLQRAQKIFPKSNSNQSKKKTSWWSAVTGFFSGSKETDKESLRTDVKKITSSTSDSDFLLWLKGIDDKDLEDAIQAAVKFACSQLSSSIDAVVKKMTHSVLRMQQNECKRLMQLEKEAGERKELGGILADFIQAINKVADRRRTS
jgi:hypothetical protein